MTNELYNKQYNMQKKQKEVQRHYVVIMTLKMPTK